MRIFLICQQSLNNHPIPAYRYWEIYFKRGIEEGGGEWLEAAGLDWAEGLMYSERKALKNWRERTWEAAVSYIKKQHQTRPIEMVLAYLFPKQVEPAAVKRIQSFGIPCVNFFCDNIRELVKVPTEFRCFDLHWVPEFKARKMYRQAGLKHMYAPMPYWVPPDKRVWQHPESYEVTFIGSRDQQRETLFAAALKLGVSLEIRGKGWEPAPAATAQPQRRGLRKIIANQPRFIAQQGFKAWARKGIFKLRPRIADGVFNDYVRKRPDDDEYIKITQQSIITIGVNRYPSYRHPFSKPNTYSRLRDIQAPMMGGCYLTEWTEGLDQLYDIGKEIEIYRTPEEMVERIRELKRNPEKRKSMRRKAQRRALTDHSIKKSIGKIKTVLGLN